MSLKIAGLNASEFLEEKGINLRSAGNALRAGAGLLSLYEATKKDKVNQAKVSPLMLEAINKAKKISEIGMPYEQKMAAIKDLNNSYAGAMKNVMAISGGQRGSALANIGAVDANRVSALTDLAGQSAGMRIDGMKMYQQAVGDYSKLKLTADMGNEQVRVKFNEARKERLLKLGSNLYEQALEFNRNLKDEETNTELINAIKGYNNENPDAATQLGFDNAINPLLDFNITNTNIPEDK